MEQGSEGLDPGDCVHDILRDVAVHEDAGLLIELDIAKRFHKVITDVMGVFRTQGRPELGVYRANLRFQYVSSCRGKTYTFHRAPLRKC